MAEPTTHTAERAQRWGARQGRLLAGLVLVLGLALSAAAALYVQRNLERAANNRFQRNAERAVQELAKRMEAYQATIRSAAGLFAGSETVTHEEFRRFVEAIDLARNYPGIQGLGFTVRLRGTPEEREREVREQLGRAPGGPAPPGMRESAILFLEPLDMRNRAALGYDMYSESVRRAAMARARDTGEPAASGKVELVQEITEDKQAGVLIYVPVYAGVETPRTLEERRERLLGWVYAPFRMGDLLKAVFSGGIAAEFAIYAGREPTEAALLYRSAPPPVDDVRTAVRQLVFAGETWTLVFSGPPIGASGASSTLPPLVFLASVLITLLLFGVLWSQVQGREAAENASARLLASEAERTRALEAERAARQEAELARHRAAFLADASATLASTLTSTDLLEQVARRTLGVLGEGCAIDLFDEAGVLRRAVVVSANPSGEAFVREAYRDVPIDDETMPTIAGVARTGEPVLIADVPPSFVERAVPERLWPAARGLLGSLVIVPLPSRGSILGTISFWSEVHGRFSAADLDLAIDLARRVALALENMRLYAGAQEAIRVRDDFLSIASHELRTPLTALQAHLQGILRGLHRRDVPLEAQSLEPRIETALRQTRRLARLVGELLDVARISAGKMQLEREPFDLAELAAELAERFREEAERAGCTLVVEAPAGVTGCWDRNRVEQVVTNLLSNAIKYGAGQPVQLQVVPSGEGVQLVVRDRGIGIPRDAQTRIFGRFERASSERHYGGLGLGLYITQEIVTAHGGQIRVHSEPGAGSAFQVELPRGC